MDSLEKSYQQAEKLLPWNLSLQLGNTRITPYWLDKHRFWFKRDIFDQYYGYQKGYCEFVLVDSKNLTQEKLFDHQRLADSLSRLLKKTISSNQLPIISLECCKNNQLTLYIDGTNNPNERVLFDRDSYTCKLIETGGLLASTSPDGLMEAVVKNYNIYLCDFDKRVEKALTDDGELHYGYGSYSDYISIGICDKKPLPPAVLWSLGSRYLAVQRIDERQVKAMPLQQSVPTDGSARPVTSTYKFAMPGDTNSTLASIYIIDIDNDVVIVNDRPPVTGLGGVLIEHACWSSDDCFYYTEWSRDRQMVRLVAFDPVAGSRVLIEEKNQSPAPLHPGPIPFEPAIFTILPEIEKLIWYSHCSGWGHLYLHDLATGTLTNPITSGDFVVTSLHGVDIDKGYVYFTACGSEPGENPYYEYFYRVNLDGSGLTLLTPEIAQHDITAPKYVAEDFRPLSKVHGLSPSADVFIDTISRIDLPYKSVLRSTHDGSELMLLAQCNPSLINDSSYHPPLDFTVKAAGKVEDLWGVIYRPSDFDKSKKYPVILAVYGGPQKCIVPKRFAEFIQYAGEIARTLAELGFIVVSLDPRGTPFRSKEFQSEIYGNMQNGGGIEDQVFALQQLGERYSWMDLNRVGITGHSNGGFASVRAMLSHPEFFKVAVASAGNYDQRGYIANWGETFQGLPVGKNYDDQSCLHLAQHLRGKLFLIHGDIDANVHISHTLQLSNQLIKYNKDFDLLVLPNRQHGYMQDTYFIRRVWDYFVQHLLDEKPPGQYLIKPPDNKSSDVKFCN